ncbi:MAG: OmpH family outer membrane protein, partial [Bacteroidota bacterium]
MKRFLVAITLMMTAGLVQGQKNQLVGFVDSDVILSKMPEFQAAQRDLMDLSAKWEAEASQIKAQLDQLQRDYLAEEVLLTNDQKKQRKEAIAAKESDLYQFREAKFGPNGAIYQERLKLVKPLQDKIYDAIQTVAKKEGYSYIFDKNGGALMLYADARYDKTLEVLEVLGIATAEEGSDKPIAPGGVTPGGKNKP